MEEISISLEKHSGDIFPCVYTEQHQMQYHMQKNNHRNV